MAQGGRSGQTCMFAHSCLLVQRCVKPLIYLTLTFAMAATVAFAASLFVDHRVAAALWAEVARDREMR